MSGCAGCGPGHISSAYQPGYPAVLGYTMDRPSRSTSPPNQEEDPLQELKFKIYRVIYPLGIVSIGIAMLFECFREIPSLFDRTVLSFLVIFFLICGLVLAWRRDYIPLIEKMTFGCIFIYLVMQLYLLLWERYNGGGNETFSTFPQWLPIIYFLAFFMFKTRQAVIASLLFFAATLVPGIAYLVVNGWRSIYIADFNALIQIYLSNAIYIPLLSGIALLKEHYVKAASTAEAMASMASIDFLTNVYNRRHLDLVLTQALEQAQRYQRPMALIIMDADRFKDVNDTHGHSAGDRVLSQLARLVQQNLRSTDTFGRWGGEEFLIIAPETELEPALQLAERLRDTLEHYLHPGIGSVTASFGVAVCMPGDTSELLIKRADDALYQAKLNGRNRVESKKDISNDE